MRGTKTLLLLVLAGLTVLATLAPPAEAQFGRGRGRGGGGGGGGPRPPAPEEGAREAPPSAGKQFGFALPDAEEAVERGEGAEAVAFYERVAARADARGARPEAARAHSALALAAVRVGQTQKAIRAGTRALEILKEMPDSPDRVGRTLAMYNVLARAYREAGNQAERRRYLEEGLAFARGLSHLRGMTVNIGQLSRQLAAIAFNQGDHATALVSAQEAVRLLEGFIQEVGSGPTGPGLPPRAVDGARRNTLETLILIGRILTTQGAFHEADATLGRARSYQRLVGLAAVEADLVGASARLALARNDHARALGEFERGIELARKVSNPNALIRLHDGAARALAGLGRFDAALASSRRAAELAEEVRNEMQDPDLRSGFLETRQGIYGFAVRVALRAAKPDEAFAFAERSRARAFLDLLGSQTVLSKGKTRALVEEETRLRSRIAEARATAEGESGEESRLGRERIAAAERDYRAFLERVRRENVEQASLMTVEPVTLGEIQGLLPEGTTLLEYLVGEQDVVVWVVDRQRALALRLPASRTALVADVREFRAAIADQAPLDRVMDRARALYARLVAPARPHIHGERLLIVPHDVLHYLPFGALRAPDDRWLVEQYALGTVPSASVLKFLAGKGAQTSDRVLAVGNPDVGPALALRYAEREARAIAQRYPGTTVLVRGEATEARTKQMAGQAGLLHFAVHGELNERDPLSSALLLVPGQGEDGRLEVRELFALELNARLVVLSACETGLGKLSRGDELVGLQRAFLYAGTPAVVTTLWKVDDRASFILMRSFYEHLAPKGPAEALRTAQRALIVDFPHPFAWAAFGLTGAPK